MNLPSLRRKPAVEIVERASQALSFNDYLSMLQTFSYNGLTYSNPTNKQEEIGYQYASLAQMAYMQNGIVFACMAVRQDLFAQARFQFRQIRDGRPGKLFGTAELAPLEEPWYGGTTGDLLGRMLQYADLGGNAYVARLGDGQLFPMRPDWTSIVGGIPGMVQDDPANTLWSPDAKVLGYVYKPGGPGSAADPITFLADEVAHFAPRPDPTARWRGMSWITPLIREVMADKAATDHKLAFFENGAALQTVVKLDVDDLDNFTQWMEKFKADHEGALNAYQTVFLGAGADVQVVGANLKDLDFKNVQGGGETRIAAAAGTPPVFVGLSEGLAGSSLNQGNYAMAKRRLADGTLRPLWQNAAGSLAKLINVPAGAELWYDDRDIAFLKEDLEDAANIRFLDSQTLKQLTDAGYTPESAQLAVLADDFTLLEHSGLLSVQLQKPGAEPPAPKVPPAAPATNGANGSRAIEIPGVSFNINEGAFQNHFQQPPAPNVALHVADGAFRTDAPPPAEVNVTVEPTTLEIADGAFRVEQPETPKKASRRKVDMGDGTTATVTDAESKVIEFDDGKTITVTDVDDE